MQFNQFDIDPRLQKALQVIGFEHPTPIQSATIAHALEGLQLIWQANLAADVCEGLADAAVAELGDVQVGRFRRVGWGCGRQGGEQYE